MIYLDTNVLVYAFCKNIDDQEQKRISQEILKSSISNKTLLLSAIVLYEFSFVCKKLKESDETIKLNLEFLSKYTKNADIQDDVIDLMQKTSSYKHSFDAYHICFSNHFNCTELVTFDNGFKRFNNYSKTDINIV
jgi:predicted nucleic acid-binding protein